MSRFALLSSVACLIAGAVAGATIAYANQPHMVNALSSLQAARAELVQAVANKGGHRERAIEAVDRAIGETRAGIAYAGG
jgi:ribose/xylose/arabinose/galactoside ABC-type transport system permease subunit